MKNTAAIFIKQIQSLLKKPVMLGQAFFYLAFVLVLSFLIGVDDGADDCQACVPAYVCVQCLEENVALDTPNPSMAGLFTVMFAGLAMVGSASSLVLEDKTTHNLRFITMAGVKPYQYLLGTAAALFAVSFVVLVLFSLVGRYFGIEMFMFLSITAAGAIVSIFLGVAIGLSKIPILATPISLLFGLGPMLSTFNEALARGLRFTYTQQVNLAVSDIGSAMASNFLLIGINGIVILFFFAWMHRKGELRW